MDNYQKDNEQEEKEHGIGLIRDKFSDAIDFIEDKYDIVIDFVAEHMILFSLLIGLIISGSLIGIFIQNERELSKEYQMRYEKYISTTIDTQNQNYNIFDVYVVYNAEKVWFCNRKLVAINEEETIKGSFGFGRGQASDYYYRDEIYEYYDLKNGERICQTHEDGFYIESFANLYSEKEVIEHNYKFSLDDLEEEISIENMLSRDPGLKRK